MHPFLDPLPPATLSALDELVKIFLEENAITNLSALRTHDACFVGNVLDSLAFSMVDNGKGVPEGTLIDIGTGGGFPLLPIALLYPKLQCTGLDAVGKKVKAVARMAEKLELKNVHVNAERTEVAGREKKHREAYDVVTARAVAPLSILLEYCSPFAKVGGHLVLWKSMHTDEERASADPAIRTLGLKELTPLHYDLPLDFGKRQLLIFKKESPTPAIYPRRIGEAKHHPITDR